VHAVLQALERRTAGLVERDNLAVEHEPVERQRPQRGDDLGIAGREDLAGPPVERDLAARAGGEDPHPVVLDLVEPAGIRECAPLERGQHDGRAGGVHLAGGRVGTRQRRTQRGHPCGARANLLDGEARQDGLRELLDRLLGAGEAVGLLEQQPLLVLAAHARQRPPPA
jgi:hypothetical protein